MRTSFFSGVLLVLATATPGQQKVADEQPAARRLVDLPYFVGAGSVDQHHLDLYLPSVERPPLVMFIHGGSWRVGNKDRFDLVGRALQAVGIACAVISYRLTPEVQHPVHAQDCARAFAWLAAHGDTHGYDTEQMYLMGHSSGAHLAALLALDPSYFEAVKVEPEQVRGVLALSGPYDVRLPIPVFTEVFGDDFRTRRRASPLDHVRGDAPPFLLLWAEYEMLGLGTSGKTLRNHLRKHDARVDWAELRSRDHATILTTMGEDDDVTTPHLVRFIERVKKGWDAEAEQPAARRERRTPVSRK